MVNNLYIKPPASGGGGVTSVTGTAPVVSSGGTTPAISMPAATSLVNGYLSATDWATFNGKQDALVSGTTIKTVNSTSLLGSGNIVTGTVTSVAALTLGTTGTDLSSTVATGTSTPVITLNVPTASASNRGALTSTDWTTFNTKGCAMGGSLNGTTITVGTTYIGIGNASSNTTETNRRISVVGGTVTFLHLRTVGNMTGTMAVTLMKNGVATAMTFTIAAASTANRYSTSANQVTVVDGDELSIRIVQSTATSIGVQGFGFIIK